MKLNITAMTQIEQTLSLDFPGSQGIQGLDPAPAALLQPQNNPTGTHGVTPDLHHGSWSRNLDPEV